VREYSPHQNTDRPECGLEPDIVHEQRYRLPFGDHDTAAARDQRSPTDAVRGCSASNRSFGYLEMIYNWRVFDVVTAHNPSRAGPANSGSCSDWTASAAH
jgi:hypothetical protein